MQGNPDIDILMIPTSEAIKKHVKDSDAITEIYNRAYEAVIISMEVKEAERNELEAENNKAKSLIGMKDDSLETYDEFYTRCLVAIGYPPDSNPTSAMDDLIVGKLLAIAQLTAERDEWEQDAERFIQLANFNNKKASEYFELHEQLVAKYGGENNQANVCNGSEKNES